MQRSRSQFCILFGGEAAKKNTKESFGAASLPQTPPAMTLHQPWYGCLLRSGRGSVRVDVVPSSAGCVQTQPAEDGTANLRRANRRGGEPRQVAAQAGDDGGIAALIAKCRKLVLLLG